MNNITRKILEGNSVRETIESEFDATKFPEIDDAELFDIQDQINDELKKSNAHSFVHCEIKPYGTGFKMIFKPDLKGLSHALAGIEQFLIHKLKWEKYDNETFKDGTNISYWR